MKSLRAVNKYLLQYKWLFVLGIVFVVTSNIFGLYPPRLIRNAVDVLSENLSLSKQLPKQDRLSVFQPMIAPFLLYFAFLIFLMSVIKGILMFFMRQTLIVMSRKVEYDQKNEIYQKYQQLSTAFYKRNNTGDLMSRISEDVSRVRMYLGPAIMYSINLLALFGMVIFTMFHINAYLSFFVLLPLPILAVSIYKVSDVINLKSEKISVALSALTSRAQEVYSGIRVIQSYAIDKQIQEEFSNASEDYKQQNISLARIESFFAPLMLLLIGLSTLMVVYIGGKEVQKGSFTAGNIAEFIFYINMLTWPVASLGWAVSLVQRAEASQKRINEFLHDDSEIKNKSTARVDTIRSIEFRDVSFTYPETGIEALKHISFSIKSGQKIAFVGRTGCGKSSLAEMLLRTYDVSSGEILVNGENLRSINLSAYRDKITYTPQDVFLFSDTVKNNILFGKSGATNEEVEFYAKAACVHEDITGLPHQYNTVVGERGVMLSGGQKQRISIARCLIKNPEIVVLDDCLSAVDAKTEQQIVQNLNRLLEGKTVVFITHRIFAVMNLDRIFVMDEGRIVEAGTHAELLEKDGIYAEMYLLQQKESHSPNLLNS